MCETLAELKQACSEFAARFDAALVAPAQLAEVLADAGTIEKIFANIAAACAARVAGGAGGGSVREAVFGLARACGTSLAGAAKALEAAKQVEAQPELARAVRLGELSRQQAGLVAGAVADNPSSATRLLELARGASVRELAEESLRARSAAWELKLNARRSMPAAPCASTPAPRAPSTCTPGRRPNRAPWSWQHCAPSPTKLSRLPANNDAGSGRRLMPGTPWSPWRARAAVAVAGARAQVVAAVAMAAPARWRRWRWP